MSFIYYSNEEYNKLDNRENNKAYNCSLSDI